MARPNKNWNGDELGFGATLWAAADKLRGNMDASEHKHVVLGLIFLKYVSDAWFCRIGRWRPLVRAHDVGGWPPGDLRGEPRERAVRPYALVTAFRWRSSKVRGGTPRAMHSRTTTASGKERAGLLR